jgi:RNA recognition motif-containing protein
MILVVRNIEHRVKETELTHLFNSYGEVTETNIVYDPTTWEPKGFAIVEMENKKEALEAMLNLNGVKLHGKSLVVKKAHVFQNRD